MKKKMINRLEALFLILPVIISSYSIASENTQFANTLKRIAKTHSIDDILFAKRLKGIVTTHSIASKDILDLANVIYNNDIIEAKRLLNSGVDGKELLHLASQTGDIKTVRTLIALGINPKEDDIGPLFAASMEGHLEIVKVLIEAGAYLTPKNTDLLFLILFLSFDKREKEIMAVLIDAGADPNAINKDDDRPSDTDAGYAGMLIGLLERGRSDRLLHTAARYAGAEAVRLLIEKGADPNAINETGNTPLHIAAQSRYYNNNRRETLGLGVRQLPFLPFKERKK